mgnify:FL=1
MSISKPAGSRRRPPSRRPVITQTLLHQGREYTVSVGADPSTGKPLEAVFHQRGKPGGDLDALLYDAGVMLSLAVQYGTPISALRAKCASPTSPIGLALTMMEDIENG